MRRYYPDALEVSGRQDTKKKVLLPIIFSKVGPGQPLITVGELKQACSHVMVRFNIKSWIEDLVRQLWTYKFLERKQLSDHDKDYHGAKAKYVYWAIRELPVDDQDFLNECVDPKTTEQLPKREDVPFEAPINEPVLASDPFNGMPSEVAIKLAAIVIENMPELVNGIKAMETRLAQIEETLASIKGYVDEQERIKKERLIAIRERLKNRKEPTPELEPANG